MNRFVPRLILIPLAICLSATTLLAQRFPPLDRHQYQKELYQRRMHGLNKPMSDSVLTVLGRWAWGSCEAVDTKGKYAYIGNGPTFQILDISTPSSPFLVSEYLTDGFVSDMRLRDTLAFVATGNSLLILDVSNPSAPRNVSQIVAPSTRVALSDSLAFVSAFGSCIITIDISDPSQPHLRGQICPPGESPDFLGTLGSIVYFASQEVDGLAIIDASNADTLRFKSEFGLPATPTAGFIRDTVLVLGVVGTITNSRLQLYSVAQPDTPRFLGETETGVSEWIRAITVDSVTAYVATQQGHVFLVDISNPASPTVRGTYTPLPAEEQGGRAIVKGGANVLVAQFSGASILDASKPDSLTRSSFFPTGGWASKIFLKDNLAYVASFASGLWILDLSDPSRPKTISNINVGGYAVDVVATDSVAYLANYSYYSPEDTSQGLWTIDVRDKSHLRALAHHIGIARYPPGALGANSIVRMGNYIVMTQAGGASYDSTFEVIDVSDPTQPSTVGILRSNTLPYHVAIQDSIAYIADADSGLRIVDLHTPNQPRPLTQILRFATGIVVKSSYAFELDADIYSIDISKPRIPVVVDSIRVTTGVISVDGAISGKYLYWADGVRMGVVDISLPTKIVSCDTFVGYEATDAVAAKADTAFAADLFRGIWILRNNLVTSAPRGIVGAAAPDKIELYQNYPNPFNPQTTIEFFLPETKRVSLKLFNVLGQEIRTLADGNYLPGKHAVHIYGRGLASGVYLCRLKSDRMTITRKVLLLH